MENIIEELCQKFNVTTNNLITELSRYYTTMDKIGIAVITVLCVLSVISLIIFKEIFKKWYDEGSWNILLITIPIVILIIGIIYIPLAIFDLISWHISPIGSVINLIRQ